MSEEAADDDQKNRRPDFTTMQGMIWNANHALDCALNPTIQANAGGESTIPPEIVQRCKGVMLLYVEEMAFFVSKTSGTGVLMAHHNNNKWSPPSAISMSSTGFGLVAGFDSKDLLVFLMTDEALQEVVSSSSKSSSKMGIQVTLAAGPVIGPVLGRDTNKVLGGGGEGSSDKDRAATKVFKEDEAMLVYGFSKGLFTGIDMKKINIKAERFENQHFYGGMATTPTEIICEKNNNKVITIPPNSGVEDLHRKLSLLGAGQTCTLTEEEKKLKESRRVEASSSVKKKTDK